VGRTGKRSFREGRLSEQVVSEIEKMISEEFPLPGLKLPKEADLAQRFGVSRIVIREAVKILEDRGLIEARAGRGTCTRAPSPDKVKESLLRLFRGQPIPSMDEMDCLLELRGVLEETAAGLAAERATGEDIAEIAAALGAMNRGGSEQLTIEADLRFHGAIARATHNRYFEMVLQPLMQVLAQQVKLTNSYRVGQDLHEAVYRAILKRNAGAARKAVQSLIRATTDDTRHALELLSRQSTVPAGPARRTSKR
jgi:GntR family transcriptional repressor for pyruvate dehydrogenase complex